MRLYRTWLYRIAVLSSVMGLFLLLSPGTTRAMYCGNDLIMEGMTKLEVVSKCGEPDLKDVASVNTVGVETRKAFRSSTTAVDVWHYNCGEGRFNRILYFDGGKLAKIENAKSYGSGPQKCA